MGGKHTADRNVSYIILAFLWFALPRSEIQNVPFRFQTATRLGNQVQRAGHQGIDIGLQCHVLQYLIHLRTWSFPWVSASTDRVALWGPHSKGPHGKAFFIPLPVITRGPWRPVAKTDRTLWRFQTPVPAFGHCGYSHRALQYNWQNSLELSSLWPSLWQLPLHAIAKALFLVCFSWSTTPRKSLKQLRECT